VSAHARTGRRSPTRSWRCRSPGPLAFCAIGSRPTPSPQPPVPACGSGSRRCRRRRCRWRRSRAASRCRDRVHRKGERDQAARSPSSPSAREWRRRRRRDGPDHQEQQHLREAMWRSGGEEREVEHDRGDWACAGRIRQPRISARTPTRASRRQRHVEPDREHQPDRDRRPIAIGSACASRPGDPLQRQQERDAGADDPDERQQHGQHERRQHARERGRRPGPARARDGAPRSARPSAVSVMIAASARGKTRASPATAAASGQVVDCQR